MIPATGATSGWPDPQDLSRSRLALAWVAAVVVLLASAVVGAQMKNVLLGFVLGMGGFVLVSSVHGHHIGTQVQRLLDRAATGQAVALRVGLVRPGTLQTPWTRPAVLAIRNGEVVLAPLEPTDLLPGQLRAPLAQLRVVVGRQFRGVALGFPDGLVVPVSVIASPGPGNSVSSTANSHLGQGLLALVAAQATPERRDELPLAGWYPDPGGRGRSRWWDGRGWTDHLR